ncbi:lamin tail domain-containing protein [Rhodohalobacter sulfatireducens]|uniref:Lamin tail domain-containing protein n=1 Tax=Rhodohalobacter sulfatireducens TaxID=2911366 RepID=A0ABS9KH90_9BACT|nr:lamin tail domain-containing protein [Rhodohalobacter sulfatireducens]MCG2590190.1 lamin tail domain-containing protein [Rhodohalobacter sulfatireducens]
MKQIATIFFSFLLVFTFYGTVEGQTTIYSDSFTGENGKGKIGTDPVDFSGVDWSVDVSDGDFTASSDFFAVQSGVFEAQDVDGTITWTSETFDISSYSSLDFSFDAGADGDFESGEDVFNVEIIVDGGTPETLFNATVDENLQGDPMFFGSTQLSNSLQSFNTSITGTGTNAEIRITVNNNAGSELYRFDNLEVSAATNATQLVITEVNNGNTLYNEVPFDITIQSQDASGNPSNVSSNVNIILSLDSGTGALSGTLTGTVPSGSNQTTISNVLYNTAESGVVIQVSDDASNLNSGNSSSLTFSEVNIVLNEFLADPDASTGDSNGDGVVSSDDDEFVEFVNTSNNELNISNWVIDDGSSPRHTFPTGTTLNPKQAVLVFGGGTPSGDFGNSIVQTTTSLNLSNSGGNVILKNEDGFEIINQSYGSGSLEADNDQSVTLNPDLTGTFEDHTTADIEDNSEFSPGTRVDGSTFQPSVTFDNGEGWRMISSPTTGNSYQDLLFDIWTQCSTNADYNGSLCSSDPNTEPNVLTYDGTDFVNAGDLDDAGNNSMTPGEGFIVYVYSDDDYDKSAADAGFPKTLDIFGSLNDGSINAPVNSGSGTFSLVGNPYNEPIDWGDLGTSDFDGTIYVYDHTYGSISGGGDDEAETRNNVGGGYRTWNESGTGSLSGGVIAPFQGFWVESSVPSPTLTFEESSQSTGGTFYTKENDNVISLRIRSEMENMYSEAFLSFTENGQLGDDKNDGLKLSPLDFRNYMSLSTEVEGTQMDINNLPVELYNPVEIPLHVQAFEAVESGWSLMGGEVTLSWPEMNNIPSEWKISLTDTKLNRTVDLKSASNYLFEAEGSQAKIANKEPFSPFNPKPLQKEKAVSDARFLITINPNVPDGLIDDNNPDQFTLEQNYPNPFNPTTNIKFEIAETSDVMLNVYNVMGQRVATLVNEVKAPGTYEIAWDARDMASGIYYYSLRAGGVIFNRQMTLIK